MFALVYRTKGLFGGGSGGAAGGLGCTCDDVMQVACDALDKEQHPEVQLVSSSSDMFPLLTAPMVVIMMVAAMLWVTRPKVSHRC